MSLGICQVNYYLQEKPLTSGRQNLHSPLLNLQAFMHCFFVFLFFSFIQEPEHAAKSNIEFDVNNEIHVRVNCWLKLSDISEDIDFIVSKT